jgi:hypothetical protein
MLLFVTRPDGTPLWIPETIAKDIGVKQRDRLTQAQMESLGIEKLIESRQKGPQR